MSFVSWGYFLFLACTLIIYYIFPHRFRWIVLLAASLIFCLLINVYSTAWLAATIVLTYCAAYAIARCTERGRRRGAKAILACSLVLLFGSLLVLKYLHDKTDEDHLATIKDINDSLAEKMLDGTRS